MKKIHSFAFYALATPVITLAAGSVLAEQSTDQDDMQYDSHPALEHKNDKQSTPLTKQSDQSTERVMQPESHPALDHQNTGDKSRMQNRGYMDAAPAKGMQASNLIGAEVKTTGDENVGPVSDLIIDKDGQVVAIIVGVGGFLGMGERDVAIGWDDVTRSGADDDQELRINATREDLSAAPEYKTRD